jgi:hypothetical protein
MHMAFLPDDLRTRDHLGVIGVGGRKLRHETVIHCKSNIWRNINDTQKYNFIKTGREFHKGWHINIL